MDVAREGGIYATKSLMIPPRSVGGVDHFGAAEVVWEWEWGWARRVHAISGTRNIGRRGRRVWLSTN